MFACLAARRIKITTGLAAILIAGGIYSTIVTYKSSSTIDFYQFWSISKAKEFSDGELSSPYRDLERYGAYLGSFASTSDDVRFREASRKNQQLYKYGVDVTGTPLLYVVFSLLPQDYSFSFGIFLVLRLVLLVTTFYFLDSTHKISLATLAVGILFVFLYKPLRSDSWAGNLNVFQLFSLSALAYSIRVYPRRIDLGDKFLPTAALLSALVLLVLLKPNILLVALALSASLAASCGVKIFSKAVATAGLLGMVLFIIPCFYFDSWRVWRDWLDYISIGSGKLGYDFWSGNYSTPLLVSTMLNISINSAILALLTVLIALFLIAMSAARPIGKTAVRIISDPFFCSAAAISVTFALSPLSWHHYYCVSLLPALWLINMKSDLVVYKVLGILSLALSSGIVPKVLRHEWINPYFVVTSWIPLWMGSLILISTLADEKKEIRDL